MSDHRVTHNEGIRRFEVETAHGTAYLSYVPTPDGKALDLQHTVVPEDAEGEGVGSALVEAAVAHARASDLKLIPSCRFAVVWSGRHPEHAGLFTK